MNKVSAALAIKLHHAGYGSKHIARYLSQRQEEVSLLLASVVKEKAKQPAPRAVSATTGSCYGEFSMFNESRLKEAEWKPALRQASPTSRKCVPKKRVRCPTKGCDAVITEGEECCQACYQLLLAGRKAVDPTTQYCGGTHFWE